MPNTVRVGTQVTGVGKSSSELDKLRDKFDKLQKQGAKGFAIGAGAAATAKGFDLIGSAVSGVVGTVENAIDAASRLREATSLSTQVFGKNTAAIDQWAAGAARAFGESKTEALDFASKFGTAFKNVGQSLDDTAKHAEEMTHLAADLGSAFDRSSEEAAVALRSGLLGESEPLRAFGVFLDEAKVKAKAASMGIVALGGALTDGQKVAARYALIMEQTADSQGMFGRDLGSAADAQKKASAILENAMARLGNIALPLVASAALGVADGLEAVTSAMDLLNGKMPQGTQAQFDLGKSLIDVGLGLSQVGILAPQADQALDALEKKTKEMAVVSGTSWAITADHTEGAASSMARATKSMDTSIKSVGKATKSARQEVEDSLHLIVSAFDKAKGDLESAASDAADAIYDPIIDKAELAANKRDQAEQRAIVSSKKSTKEQVADAKLRLAELTKDKIKFLAELAAYGDKSAATTLQNMIDILKATKHLSKSQIAQLKLLEAELARLKRAAKEAADYISRITPEAGHVTPGSGRASGGPVAAGKTYTVGEDSEETLVMYAGGGGFVIPKRKRSGPPPMPTGSGGGVAVSGGGGWGGLTIVVQGVSVLTPGSAEALGRQLEPVITKHQQRQGHARRAAGAA